MWVVVGLGNPGAKYAKTRHNVGFMAIDEVSARHHIELKERPLYLIGRGSIFGQDVIALKPLTFMNRSGDAVKEVLLKHKLSAENLIVVHDDIDMASGRLKIKEGGSSGGHNGVQSIIESIGSREFIRVKIGIGRNPEIPPEEYVLQRFSSDEKPIISATVKQAADAIEKIIEKGLTEAMNIFNKRP